MAEIIAGIYEIQEKIGAGGGGVVYLGRHLRLKKPVVLKADKRRLSTSEESLRREVDLLKELSHTYIPQVYDYVQQDGVVYTVMDYIEGESLDKLLARKQRPSQAVVIQWACELLEALSYLHSQPPYGILHGDIKPANIMLRPQGDIRLIDFNIALALGEDGAVKVGFSRGYASPEHYGADYISQNRTAAVGTASIVTDKEHRWRTSRAAAADNTEAGADTDVTVADDAEAGAGSEAIAADKGKMDTGSDIAAADNQQGGESTTQRRSGIKLDVRSDIYSLGATLYHLLSGTRPDKDALNVVPLGPDVCSQAVADIISKSMAPDPQQRYQTADEMLTAFRMLHKCDGRVVRHRRRAVFSAAALSVIFLLGGASALAGLKQLEQMQASLAMAEYSTNALAEGNVSEAVTLALQAAGAPVMAQAQKALTDALGVYRLEDGFQALDVLELPAEPFDIAVSPQGTCFAAVYAYEAAVYSMEDQKLIVSLPIENSAMSDVVFADETHIIYAGAEGVTAYDLERQSVLWTGETATMLAVSGDGSILAAVNRNADHAVIYSVEDGVRLAECSFEGQSMSVAANDIFADPGNAVFALNEDGSLLAVSFGNGGLMLLDWAHPEENLLLLEESDYVRFAGGFCGRYFAFAAQKGGESLFELIDTAEAVIAGGYRSQESILLKAAEEGIYLAEGNLLVGLEIAADGAMEEKELAYTGNVNITGFAVGEEYVLTATDDNGFSFYDAGADLSSSEYAEVNCDFVALAGDYAVIGNRNEPALRLLRRDTHEASQLLTYDARYVHDEARVSQDGRSVMLFGYQSFCIYDMDGNLRMQAELPDAENIYDQQFVREGNDSWLEVVWYDGMVRRYDAWDGSLLLEEQGDVPEKDLYEEFLIGDYRVTSALHGTPEVYHVKSGRLAAVLEKDAFLTYVTQSGEYMIAEYINTSGERYGILMDQEFQTLAYLPNLCDVVGDRLIFDYGSGHLRQSPVYSLEELVELGEAYCRTEGAQ